MNPPRIRTRWARTYRRAEYRALLPLGQLVMYVGRHCPAWEGRLRREAGVRRSWAIITPCNPGSRPLEPAVNAARLEAFEIALVDGGLRSVPSINRDPIGSWPDEPGFLVCDPKDGLAECLARTFGQNAFVAARLGDAPELVWV